MTKKKREFPFFDDEEKDIIESLERGEWKPLKNQKAAKAEAAAMAKRHLRKDARVNIRLSHADVETLKTRAAEEGLPYQTLMASVLHKYVSGRLKEAR